MDAIKEKQSSKQVSFSNHFVEGLKNRLKNPIQDVKSIFSVPKPLVSQQKIDTALPHIKAKIVDITKETHDTKSYFFVVDQAFANYKAGSHINIEFKTEKDTIKRTYTLSSSPKQLNKYSITVKRVNEGLASNWLFENLIIGDELTVSQPQGDFVLPYQPAGKMLLLSAGSGITPVMSMLRYLAETGNRSDIVFLHYAQSPNDIIFRDELVDLVSKHSGLRTVFSVEDNAVKGMEKGRISQKQLSTLIPDLNERAIYMCGPQPFMKATMDILNTLEFNPSQLHFESFTNDLSSGMALGYSADITFSSIHQTVSSTSSKTILEEAEAAGLTPTSACRMGICRTCRCKKQSGTTVNLATGEVSDKDGDYILPCVSVAKTNTTVEL